MNAESLNILYIDDDQDDHLFFKLALDSVNSPFKLNFALNGKEGLELLNKLNDKPTHIFLDLSMPVMNGLEFLKVKNKNKSFKSIPTFVYSTSNRASDIEKALDLGAIKFFTKPNQIEKISKILSEILELDT